MAVLPIITGADNPLLRKKTKPLKEVTKKILTLIKNMEVTMKKAQGVGLAAPQVGENLRICIAMIDGKLTALISPEITKRSKEKVIGEEGCLSLPGIYLEIPRSVEISVTFLNTKGKKQERTLKDFDARVVQHEVDHLEGMLIVDYSK